MNYDELLDQVLKTNFEKDYPSTYRRYLRSGDKLTGFDYPSFIGTYGDRKDKRKFRSEELSRIIPYLTGDHISAFGTPDTKTRQELLSRINKYKLNTASEKRGRKLYHKLVKLIGKEKLKGATPLSAIEDSILNFSQSIPINGKHPDYSYDDVLKRYGLKYNDQDVMAARDLQIRAVRDAVNKELGRRNYHE